MAPQGGWDDAFFRNIAKRTPTAFNTPAVALAQRGYATLSIMRRGFGLSGGSYSEELLRPCDYLAAERIAADDIIVAMAAARREPWVDPDHILLLGHSTGGLTMLAVAERNPAGVVGVLNFDGGYHAMAKPDEACSPDRLVGTVASLGRTARVPALWLYAENDRSDRRTAVRLHSEPVRSADCLRRLAHRSSRRRAGSNERPTGRTQSRFSAAPY
ncbi:pimeloyl-ACP methyl ester carboxylesterase [Bradyrhizobium japonicum]